MKQLLRVVLLINTLLMMSAAHAELQVLACEPEWAALLQELGAGQIKLSTATTAMQDPHHIQARPSLISKARRADLLVCTGAGLEAGWLPLLQRKSGNRRIQTGQPGAFMAADFVKRLNVPSVIDRSAGDIHAGGNPHFQTDPRRILVVAGALASRLAEIDSAHTNQYRQSYDAFVKNWQHKIQQWQKQASVLKGKRVIVHHDQWVYLNDWLGLQQVNTLEPKPGVPPSSSHLASLKQQISSQPVDAIIRASIYDARPAQWLSEHGDVPVAELPATVGAMPDTDTLTTFFDFIVQRLLEVMAKGNPQ